MRKEEEGKMRKQNLLFGIGWIGLLILLLLVLMSCTASVSQAQTVASSKIETLLGRAPLNPEEAAIANLFTIQIEAMEKGNTDLFASVYSEDLKIKTHGWGLIDKKVLTEKMRQYISGITNFEIKNLKVNVADGEATSTAFKSFLTSRGPRSANYTFVLKKIEGKWLIVNEAFD